MTPCKAGLKRFDGNYKETHIITPNDVVIAITDMTQERRIVARAARIPDFGQEIAIYSMDLVKVVPNKGMQNEFIYGMFRYSSFPDEVKQYANGANVLHLNPEKILDFRFPLPIKHLREKYSEIVSKLYAQYDVLDKKNTNLRQTLDLLLPKLISGEISLST